MLHTDKVTNPSAVVSVAAVKVHAPHLCHRCSVHGLGIIHVHVAGAVWLGDVHHQVSIILAYRSQNMQQQQQASCCAVPKFIASDMEKDAESGDGDAAILAGSVKVSKVVLCCNPVAMRKKCFNAACSSATLKVKAAVLRGDDTATGLTVALLRVSTAGHEKGLATAAALLVLNDAHCTLLLSLGGEQVQLGDTLCVISGTAQNQL